MNKLERLRILILGAGFGQLPAIKAAKSSAAKVIVFDKNPLALGFKYSDENYVIDIIDEKEVLRKALQLNINFAFTMQSDHGVRSVALVNEKLGVKSVPYETALICSDKCLMREVFDQKNIPQPRFKIANSLKSITSNSKYFEFPFMIKCPDSSGSRGVSKINSLDDLEKAYEEAIYWSEKKEFVLIEEYVEGYEFGAQTFSLDGNCEIVLLHNDKISNPPYMIPVGHSFPFNSPINLDIEEIKDTIKTAVNAIGIVNGVANIDLIYDTKKNKIQIIEIGARMGATCLPELIQAHTGVDWVEKSLEALKPNSQVSKDDLVCDEIPCAAEIFYSGQDGILNSINIPKELIEMTNLKIDLKVKRGDQLKKLRKGTDRFGSILYYQDGDLNPEKTLEEIKRKIKIELI